MPIISHTKVPITDTNNYFSFQENTYLFMDLERPGKTGTAVLVLEKVV